MDPGAFGRGLRPRAARAGRRSGTPAAYGAGGPTAGRGFPMGGFDRWRAPPLSCASSRSPGDRGGRSVTEMVASVRGMWDRSAKPLLFRIALVLGILLAPIVLAKMVTTPQYTRDAVLVVAAVLILG